MTLLARPLPSNYTSRVVWEQAPLSVKIIGPFDFVGGPDSKTYHTKRKVIVTALDAYYLGVPDRNGLPLGYGGLSLAELRQGVQILAEVIAEQARQGE